MEEECNRPTRSSKNPRCESHYKKSVYARRKIQLGDICKAGHVIIGDNAQHYLNNGAPSIRCTTCVVSKLHRTPRMKVGDICAKGHEVSGENIYIQPHKDGEGRIRCRTCRNNWYKERRENKVKVERKIKVAFPVALEAIHNKMESTDPKCLNNSYRYVDYNEDFPPTADLAQALCSGCPVLDECKVYAYAQKPYMGVWAGEVWQSGKVRK